MKKIVCLVLAFAMVIACGACCAPTEAPSRPPLSTEFVRRENAYGFSAQPSETLQISSARVAQVQEVVSQMQPDYTYEALYGLEEVKNRLDFDASVEQHQFCALNDRGVLDGEHLAELVKANNGAYMAEEPFGYTVVEEDYIAQLCDFIAVVVNVMTEKYPDVDWQRVYCNLGNLKILYDVGMLSFAEVSPDMVLSISKNNTQIVLTLKGEDGFTRVLTHEIMHIIQIGCACEQIENCGRRAGIAMYWNDFTLNTADWTWMAEGSAERNMCNLTGGEAVTYQYKMDYLCSMTLSVLLRDAVHADTMETICFYDDPQLLFDAFGCETEAQRDELIKMMITLQVLQIQPKSFHIAYTEQTGVDLLADEEAMNRFSYMLKPAICITLAKEFYENLLLFLQEQQLTCNDLFFLLNLFEGHVNQHLLYTREDRLEVNQPFLDAYTAIRAALFSALEQDNPGLELAAMYAQYDMGASGDQLLNADLAMLPETKRAFLAERAKWMMDLVGHWQKVP